MTTYVLMAGLPGAGKTALATALAQRLDGVRLGKDEVRAALFPGSLTDYSREQDGLVFDAILQAASYLARHRRTEWIFLDGRTFSRKEQIDPVLQCAEAEGCAWKILYLTCPDSVAEARLLDGSAAHPASNRTMAMYTEVKSRFEPILYPHRRIETVLPLAECVEQAREWLLDVEQPE